MDLISDLNSEIALAVLVENRHREKLELREAIKVMCRISSALQPLSQPNEEAGRRGSESLSKGAANRGLYL